MAGERDEGRAKVRAEMGDFRFQRRKKLCFSQVVDYQCNKILRIFAMDRQCPWLGGKVKEE